MATKYTKQLDWIILKTETFPKSAQQAIDAYRKHEKAAVEAKRVATDALTKGLEAKGLIPDGKEPRYSFRFGRVSIAFDEPAEKRVTTNAPTLGLDD